MALQAVQKSSLPDKVFEQLAGEILSGRYEPGATIPSERDLSELLAVNRHVVREAVKRLEQVGLVRVAQGGRTRVLDFRRTAGLDVLALVAEHAEPSEALLPLMLGVLEMRAAIGADLARLCAVRAGTEAGDELLEIAALLHAAREGSELVALDERFWRCVLDGSGNLAYQLAFNSLIRALHARLEIGLPWLERELLRSDFRRPIAEAIAAGDAESAAIATREALTPRAGDEVLAAPAHGSAA
jgi:GntR family transcriptional regulator, transcriptional repressor for pyruvate dehydrogenase complex